MDRKPTRHPKYGEYKLCKVNHKDPSLSEQGVVIPITIAGHFSAMISPGAPVWLPEGVIKFIKEQITQTKWRLKKQRIMTRTGREIRNVQESYQEPLYEVTPYDENNQPNRLVVNENENHDITSTFPLGVMKGK